jgi:hemerythrin-like metal-binding protein
VTIPSFVWSPIFATDLPEVDLQHQSLFEQLGVLSNLVESKSFEEIPTVLRGLEEYISVHFATEERMMRESGVDSAHLLAHGSAHEDFAQQVLALQRGVVSDDSGARAVFDFVSSWFVQHILGTDQLLGRQLTFMSQGLSPDAALRKATNVHDSTTQLLLQALGASYRVVSGKNLELALLNAALEARVESLSSNAVDAQEPRRLGEALEELGEALTGLGRLLHEIGRAATNEQRAGVIRDCDDTLGRAQSVMSRLKVLGHRLGG